MSPRLLWSAILLSSSAHAGFIEICKDSIPIGAVSGLYSFNIAGQGGTVTAPVGACSSAFQLPDGLAMITEVPQIGAVLFSVSTFPTSRLISFDLTARSAVVQIVPGDISTQTVVTFFNANAPLAAPIPEPGTGWLLGSCVGLLLAARKLVHYSQQDRKDGGEARSVLLRLLPTWK